MSDKDTTEHTMTVIVMRSTFTDWLSGIATIVLLTAMSVANHRYGGGSSWLDALAVLLAFSTLMSRAVSKSKTSFRGTKDEAIKHIKEMWPEPPKEQT